MRVQERFCTASAFLSFKQRRSLFQEDYHLVQTSSIKLRKKHVLYIVWLTILFDSLLFLFTRILSLSHSGFLYSLVHGILSFRSFLSHFRLRRDACIHEKIWMIIERKCSHLCSMPVFSFIPFVDDSHLASEFSHDIVWNIDLGAFGHGF